MSMDRKIEKKSWIKRNILFVVFGVIVISFIFYQIAFAEHGSKLVVESDKITIEEIRKDLFQ